MCQRVNSVSEITRKIVFASSHSRILKCSASRANEEFIVDCPLSHDRPALSWLLGVKLLIIEEQLMFQNALRHSKKLPRA
jgi:hypothetical protein